MTWRTVRELSRAARSSRISAPDMLRRPWSGSASYDEPGSSRGGSMASSTIRQRISSGPRDSPGFSTIVTSCAVYPLRATSLNLPASVPRSRRSPRSDSDRFWPKMKKRGSKRARGSYGTTGKSSRLHKPTEHHLLFWIIYLPALRRRAAWPTGAYTPPQTPPGGRRIARRQNGNKK